jgi:predicted acylesterase/phospholipase RssA
MASPRRPKPAANKTAKPRAAPGRQRAARRPAPGPKPAPHVPAATRKFGLALAGGGPIGAMYEIGAVAALAEALEGIDFNDLYVYVGVSSGAVVSTGLANGLSPAQMCRMFVENVAEGEVPFHPEILLQPALREYVKRVTSVPPLVLASIWHYLTHPFSQNIFDSFQRLGRAVPTGIFNNAAINEFLTRLFTAQGRTNDFRELKRKLYLVATDLDTGTSVEFGSPGWDHVPISTAVQASAALPGLFPPVEIGGRYYVDGALKKTLHASVALRQGAELVLCVNPLVPFDYDLAARRGHPGKHRLVEGGLPLVLSQTFRAIIYSRMQVGMGKYASEFKNADVVLFEPNRDDADMFFTNVFSYRSRRRLAEHAYQKTRSELYRRRHELGPILARHGIRIRLDVLKDTHRRLIGGAVPMPHPVRGAVLDAADRLDRCLDDLDRWLHRRSGAQRQAA